MRSTGPSTLLTWLTLITSCLCACSCCCCCCVRSVDALESHDLVCWLGDLNYRINGNSKAVRHLMRSRLHEVLHANDQLRLQQKMGTVFQVCVGGGCCGACGAVLPVPSDRATCGSGVGCAKGLPSQPTYRVMVSLAPNHGGSTTVHEP
jgi:hypothetical protein